MKRYIIILLSAVLLLPACSEEILDVENKGSLTVENWYKTEEDFQLALNSCYIPMAQRGMYALVYNHTFATWEDRTLFESTPRDRITVTSSDSDPEDVWDALYMGLYRTSKLLQQLKSKGVEGIENMNEATYSSMAAQAKALRGLYYFYLVTVFDRPVFYTEENIPEDLLQDMTNADQEKFWTQLELDFKEAIPHLESKSEQSPDDRGRVTSGAARAMLGKAMLYKHYYYHVRFGNKGSSEDIADLTTAADAFRTVISSGEYQLILPMAPKTRNDYIYALLSNTSFVDLPTENNTYISENNAESVWEIQFADYKALQDNPWLPGYFGPGALFEQYYGAHQTSYRNHEAHPALYYEFETEGAPAGFDRDPRCYASFYFDGDLMDFDPASPYHTGFISGLNDKKIAAGRGLNVPPGTESLGIKKGHFPVYWDGLYAPFNDPVNRRMIRYADVLLMYAETMYILGDDGSGFNALNEVRQRVDMPPAEALTTSAIIHERDIELAFEGHRWFDLVRWSFDDEWGIDWNQINWGIDAANSVNPFKMGKNEFLPIPINEIDLNNGALKQNPGW